MNLDLLNTLDDADRIVATDLYPARCRTVISALAAALRSMSTDLAESRVYGLALVAELKARSGQEAERDALRAALKSIADNTCCDGCREAALVARAALKGDNND